MKQTLALTLLLLTLVMLNGCTINSSARPSTEFANINELLTAVENAPLPADEEEASRFMRDLSGLVQKSDKTVSYENWTRIPGEEEEKQIYKKNTLIYGMPAEISIAVVPKRNWIGALSVSVEGEDAWRLASVCTAGMYKKIGTSYQAQIGEENAGDSAVKELLSSGSGSQAFSVIWPKSSLKWSAMISYQPGQTAPVLTINVM